MDEQSEVFSEKRGIELSQNGTVLEPTLVSGKGSSIIRVESVDKRGG